MHEELKRLDKERISRQALATYEHIFLLRRAAGYRGKLTFVPGLRPRFERSFIYKICRELGWSIAIGGPSDEGLKIFWPPDERVQPNAYPDLINGRCVDINKSTVERLFKESFGYGCAIDPLTQTQPYVRKSELNALHDGMIFTEPTEPEDGFVYQRLIDTVAKDGRVEDIRLNIIGSVLPKFDFKRRRIENRFVNVDAIVTLEETRQFLSEDEITKVNRLCGLIGLQHGALDCLRDRNDGLLYVVDVNRTPWGPPVGMPDDQAKKSVRLLAEAFAQAFAS